MANKTLFGGTSRGRLTPATDTVNEAGGVAYKLSDKQALAQYAFTGTLHNTFYVKAQTHLETVIRLCDKVAPSYVAKVAVAAREKGFMKDMPAILAAYLHAKGHVEILETIFNRVLDNGKMLKNFVQIIRSGVLGRKSFGTRTKLLIQNWLDERDDTQLLWDNIGNDPSLADVIKMVHVRPSSKTKAAAYGWIVGKPYNPEYLPERFQQWHAYKANPAAFERPPKVPFQMLSSLELDTAAWSTIARNASWQEARQSLNTYARHGVFEDAEMVALIANKLRNKEQIVKSKVFPYQLLAAYLNTGPQPQGFGWSATFWTRNTAQTREQQVPQEIRIALQEAMEVAVENVPSLPGKTYICIDTSGSMGYPVTGDRGSATTKVRCVDVAGLVASAFLRTNKLAELLPFDTRVHNIDFNPFDSVMTNSEKFRAIGGGGTSCSAPLALLNQRKAKGDLVLFVSDYESWADRAYRGTAMLEQWNVFKHSNPEAKLVCIDLTPQSTGQVKDDADILRIGGFSDQVFTLVDQFARGELIGDHWVKLIETAE